MNTTIQGHEVVGGATKRGAPDPSVKLPDSVRGASERANALIEQAKAAKLANDKAGLNDTFSPANVRIEQPAANNPTVVTGNYDPNNPRPPEFGDPNDTRVQSRTFVPPTAPDPSVPQFTPPNPPQPATPQNESDWEHQFKSLKGRYDRDAEEKRRLQQTVLDQQRLLANISPPSSPQGEGSGVRFDVAPPPPGRYVKSTEVQEFGPELMDVVGRRAQEVYEPVVNQLLSELQQVKRQVGGVRNTVVFDARVKMYDDLARTIPNWDTINNSPQFGHWLDQVDPISHRTRREFLNAAHNTNTTSQVVDIFRSFLSATGAANPSPTPGNGQVTTPQYNGASNGGTVPPQVDLMQFAAPGRAKDGQTQVPPPKEIIRRSEIKQFYTEKTAGKWAGREADAASIEQRIFAAGNEGRIVDG